MLDNIRMWKFFMLDAVSQELYNEELQFVKERNYLPTFLGKKQGKQLGNIQFSVVEGCKAMISEGGFDNIAKVFSVFFGINRLMFNMLRVKDFYHGYNYIISEFTKWSEIEGKFISPENKNQADLELAGIDRLSMFGSINRLIHVAREFSVPVQEVEKWTYADVIIPFGYSQIESQIQSKYQEIKIKKNVGR